MLLFWSRCTCWTKSRRIEEARLKKKLYWLFQAAFLTSSTGSLFIVFCTMDHQSITAQLFTLSPLIIFNLWLSINIMLHVYFQNRVFFLTAIMHWQCSDRWQAPCTESPSPKQQPWWAAAGIWGDLEITRSNKTIPVILCRLNAPKLETNFVRNQNPPWRFYSPRAEIFYQTAFNGQF